MKLARDGRHGRGVVALVAALTTGLGGLAAVITSTVGSSPADASVGSATTFTSTGAEQSVVVPAGATQMHVVAVGGGGGSANNTYAGATKAPGGKGAQVVADLPAPSGGSTVYVEVGRNGPAGVAGGIGGGATGGFNGGAMGTGDSGAGGGASDLRTVSASGDLASSLSSRLLVAGGGGGGGSPSLNCSPAGCGSQAQGGPGGGGGIGALQGAPGLGTPSPRGFDGGGGGGGTAIAGGTGGAAGPNPGISQFGSSGFPGGIGTPGSGGAGGGTPNGISGGGGAGGGLFGGGGGGSGAYDAIFGVGGAGGGGGGGSSFVQTGASGVSATADASGTSSVTITFLSSSTTTAASCTPNPAQSGTPTNCTATVSASGPTPTGTITWSGPAGGGVFGSGSCTLTGASCSVTYTPASSGTQTLQASYGGDNDHLASSGTTNLVVNTFFRLAFTTPPVSGPVGGASLGPVTVQVEDGAGNPLPAPAGGSVLSLGSSSPTGVFSGSSGGPLTTTVSIPAGSSSATFFYGDTAPGSPTITVSSGTVSAAQLETVSPRLAFTTAPVTGPVSRSGLGPITVQLQDAAGGPRSAPAGGTTLSLSSSSPTGAFASTVDGVQTNQVVVAAGSNSVTFFYGDDTPGSPTITVAAAGSSATQIETVTPRLRITNTPASGQASAAATIGPITVQLQDALLNPVAAPAGGTTVSLSSESGTGFFATSSAGPTTTSVVIPAGSSSASFFYGDPSPGNPAITAATTTSTDVQNEQVNPAVLFFVTSGPVSGAASIGANLGPITVQITDLSGKPLAAPAGGTMVTLGSSSSTGLFSASRDGPPVTSVQIPAGASDVSFYYGDRTPGSPMIRMSVPFAFPTSQQETVGAPVPTQLEFTTNPVTGPASTGANLGPITVQILDSLGNPLLAPTGGTTVALGSSSGTGVFSASPNGPTTSSVQMPAGASSATFFYGDPTPGNADITAAADGLSANQQASVTAVGRLAFVTGPVTGAASSSANVGPITVQLQDNAGQPMAASADTTVGLTARHGGSGGGLAATQPRLVPTAFRGPGGCQPPASNVVFASSPGGAPITSVTIPAGQSSVSFYFADQSAGTDTISVAAPELTGTTQDETVTPGAPSHVGICGPSQLSGDTSASATLGPVSLSLLDAQGNVAVAPTGGTTVALSSTSAGAVFAASSGGARITSLTIPAGSSSATFFYGDTMPGSPTITASSPGLGSATLVASITSAITPTATTLSSVPASPTFGQKVTLNATVTVVPPGVGPPTGQVTFTDGTLVLGASPLDASGHSSLKILPIAPGPHSIVASYGGDANHSPSTSALNALVVGCTQVSGKHSGRLTISRPTCLQGATISGAVVVQPGAALSISQSTVIGQVSSNGASAVRICGSKVTGAVYVQSSNGLVIVGDGGDEGVPGCGPNNLGAPVTLSGNKGVIELGGDTVAGPVTVTGNTATGTDPENRTTEIEANRITGPLACSGNNPPPTNDGLGNQVSGPRTGQCKGL